MCLLGWLGGFDRLARAVASGGFLVGLAEVGKRGPRADETGNRRGEEGTWEVHAIKFGHGQKHQLRFLMRSRYPWM